jgi:hypothetical protein
LQIEAHQKSQEIDRQHGFDSEDIDAVGDTQEWGAENSIITVYGNTNSYADVQYLAALKGLAWNQKAVIPFREDPDGDKIVYTMDIQDDMESIRANLDKVGLQYRSLIPGEGRTRVLVYDDDMSLGGNVAQLGEVYGDRLTGERTVGEGEFLGNETREGGAAKYRAVIEAYEAATATSRVPGRYRFRRQGNDYWRYGQSKRLQAIDIDRFAVRAMDRFRSMARYAVDEVSRFKGGHPDAEGPKDCGHKKGVGSGNLDFKNTCAEGSGPSQPTKGKEQPEFEDVRLKNRGKGSGSKRKRARQRAAKAALPARERQRREKLEKAYSTPRSGSFGTKGETRRIKAYVGKEINYESAYTGKGRGKNKKYLFTQEHLPERFKGLIDDDDLRSIKNPAEFAWYIHSVDRAAPSLGAVIPGDISINVLPHEEEFEEAARAGESVRGQYAWAGDFFTKLFESNPEYGARMAHTWAGLNSILSANSEYIEHTVGSFDLLADWLSEGAPGSSDKSDPRNVVHTEEVGVFDKKTGKPIIDEKTGKQKTEIKKYDKLDLLIAKWANKTRPALRKGKEMPNLAPVARFTMWSEAKENLVTRLLNHMSNPEAKFDPKLITTDEESRTAALGKTPDFWKAWFEKQGFPVDLHMSKLLTYLPPRTGMSVAEAMVDGNGEAAKLVRGVWDRLATNPVLFTAYKTLGNHVAKKLGWTLEQTQEAVWSTVIAVGTLKKYARSAEGKAAGFKESDIVDSIDHEMVHQSWDIRGLLKRKDMQDALRRLGFEESDLKDIDSWESHSKIPEPPTSGKYVPRNRAALEALIRRVPPTVSKTAKDKRVILPGRGTVHQYQEEEVERILLNTVSRLRRLVHEVSRTL